MARIGAAILTFVLAALSVAWADIDPSNESPAPNDDAKLQRALDSLKKGDYEGAELRSQALLRRNADLNRVWLVIAKSRQERKMYNEAAAAFRNYLTDCPSGELRQFVAEQIQSCRKAASAPAPLQAATAGLTPHDLLDLARIDEAAHTESSEHFVVKARNAKLAKLVVGQCETALARICGDLLGGQEFPHSVRINVWGDAKEYRDNAQDAPEWSGGAFSVTTAGGVTIRRIDLTQTDGDGKFSTIMLDRVLPHELCHLVTQEYFGDANCPLFLNEGLAMLSETVVDNGRLTLAGAALSGKERLPLERLLSSRRDGMDKVEVFYAEAYSFTEYLRTRLAARQFKDFLDHVRGGCTVADALQRALYLPDDDAFLPALAEAWQDRAIQQAQATRALLK